MARETADDRSFDAGQEAFQRYSFLVNERNLPFVRAASSNRVVVSAQNWTNGSIMHALFTSKFSYDITGFSFASQHRFTPTFAVIISESVCLPPFDIR